LGDQVCSCAPQFITLQPGLLKGILQVSEKNTVPDGYNPLPKANGWGEQDLHNRTAHSQGEAAQTVPIRISE
jgi:hypothetical protein